MELQAFALAALFALVLATLGTAEAREVGEDCPDECPKGGKDNKLKHTDGKVILYHATSREAAKKIKKVGFRVRGSAGKVGPGIYFAEKPDIAERLAVGGKDTLLQATVNVGCVLEIEDQMNASFWEPKVLRDIKNLLADRKCDSMLLTYLKDHEIAIFDGIQASGIKEKIGPLWI